MVQPGQRSRKTCWTTCATRKIFKVQRQILARYHMTNPDNWYQRSSLWDVPNDPVAGDLRPDQGAAVLPVGEVARR